ncbi:hypothetical protein PIB30_070328 [Stylosanthes scabra]|uniref:Replication protein A 70 kDa DNA-binding subunit B/D first OB fold domain-containing protein n=1 Tax=Stylosanthes scabra TaxID=79078 RepID=A0ABU6RND5_9FABA|nr:hypothetical protein [Stylosanthes scabra]
MEWYDMDLELELEKEPLGFGEEKLRELLGLLGKVIVSEGNMDRLVWKHDKRGEFSVSSFVRMMWNRILALRDLYGFAREMQEHVLNPRRQWRLRSMHWTILVYVIRKYEVPSFEDPATTKSVDLILQDSQGSRIHASIPKRLISTWSDKINDFSMYNMKEFVVVDKRISTFPLEPFRFRTILELTASAVVTENELFDKFLKMCRVHSILWKDLVAEVVGKEDPRDLITSLGKEIKRMSINLQDLEKNTIRVVLFGTCVDDLTPLMAEERVEPLIVVLQFFRVNRWDGKTSVQSHFDISKVCCGPVLKEIQDFLNSMVDTGTSSSICITQMQSQSSGQGIEGLRHGLAEIKTIEDVWSLTEVVLLRRTS